MSETWKNGPDGPYLRAANEFIQRSMEADMAARVQGAVKDGKFSPKKEPPHFAAAKKSKADRVESGLRKNRERARGKSK